MNTSIIDLIVPISSAIFGTIIGNKFDISRKIMSSLQHLVVGMIFAAISIEFIPQITSINMTQITRIAIIFGLFLGATLMIIIRSNLDKNVIVQKFEDIDKIPIKYIIAIGIDFLMAGILIGIISASTKNKISIIIIAICVEIFFLGMTVGIQMKVLKTNMFYFAVTAFIILIIFGFTFGYVLTSLFKHHPIYFILLSFSLASIIWLITEELLLDADRGNIISIVGSTLLYLGFIFIIIINWFNK